jgi:hypothetical protein
MIARLQLHTYAHTHTAELRKLEEKVRGQSQAMHLVFAQVSSIFFVLQGFVI